MVKTSRTGAEGGAGTDEGWTARLLHGVVVMESLLLSHKKGDEAK